MISIFKGDDTAAFGGLLLRIRLKTDLSDIVITKAKVGINSNTCHGIVKEYPNPTFPLDVNLTTPETALLQPVNNCYLAVWDSESRKRTATGTITFDAQGFRV